MAQYFFDNLPLFNKRDDFHHALALWTNQGVDFIDFLDQASPIASIKIEEHAQSALLAFLNGFAHSGKLQGSHGLLFIILFHDFFHSKEGFCWMAVQH